MGDLVQDWTKEDTADAADGGNGKDLVMIVSDMEITTLSKTHKCVVRGVPGGVGVGVMVGRRELAGGAAKGEGGGG